MKGHSIAGLALALSFAAAGPAHAVPPQGPGSENLPPDLRALSPPAQRSAGPPVSSGAPVLAAPRLREAAMLPASAPLAADTVIATETIELPPLHFRLAEPIAIGAPFNANYPAGTDIARLVQGSIVRDCVREHGPYRPPLDENRQIYSSTCLEDRDGDGRYETAILLPYLRDALPERRMAIAPVRIEPNPDAMAGQPDGFEARRRIRVAELRADAATVVVEQSVAPAGEGAAARFFSRPEDRVSLPLQAGARASLGGVELRLERDGEQWRLVASGRFAPWLEVRENGALVLAGAMRFRIRS